jgi:hypothetical protein
MMSSSHIRTERTLPLLYSVNKKRRKHVHILFLTGPTFEAFAPKRSSPNLVLKVTLTFEVTAWPPCHVFDLWGHAYSIQCSEMLDSSIKRVTLHSNKSQTHKSTNCHIFNNSTSNLSHLLFSSFMSGVRSGLCCDACSTVTHAHLVSHSSATTRLEHEQPRGQQRGVGVPMGSNDLTGGKSAAIQSEFRHPYLRACSAAGDDDDDGCVDRYAQPGFVCSACDYLGPPVSVAAPSGLIGIRRPLGYLQTPTYACAAKGSSSRHDSEVGSACFVRPYDAGVGWPGHCLVPVTWQPGCVGCSWDRCWSLGSSECWQLPWLESSHGYSWNV